jgi:hypothetical protein
MKIIKLLNKNKKLTFLVLSALLLALMSFGFLLVKTLSINNTSKIANDETELLPESYPIMDNSLQEQKLEFTLTQENVATPLRGEVADFYFESSISEAATSTLTEVDKRTILISSSQYNLLMYLPGESFGGVFDSLSVENNIVNQLNKKITRIEPKDNKFLKDDFLNVSVNNSGYYYFYGVEDIQNNCPKEGIMKYCGSDHIEVAGKNEKNINAIVRLYCQVSDKSNLRYCDEFAKNLNVIESISKISEDFVTLDKTYSNRYAPGFSFKYPSSWKVEVKDFKEPNNLTPKFENPEITCENECLGIRLSKENVSFDIILFVSFDGFGVLCSNEIDIQELQNKFFRINDLNRYVYSKTVKKDVSHTYTDIGGGSTPGMPVTRGGWTDASGQYKFCKYFAKSFLEEFSDIRKVEGNNVPLAMKDIYIDKSTSENLLKEIDLIIESITGVRDYGI